MERFAACFAEHLSGLDRIALCHGSIGDTAIGADPGAVVAYKDQAAIAGNAAADIGNGTRRRGADPGTGGRSNVYPLIDPSASLRTKAADKRPADWPDKTGTRCGCHTQWFCGCGRSNPRGFTARDKVIDADLEGRCAGLGRSGRRGCYAAG